MATEGHIEENWQTVRETIRERNKFMFNNSLLSDVKFLPLAIAASEVKDETAKIQAAIPAHKYVLAIGSPVFFAMFYGELAETTDSIELPDCDSESFLELLRYLYCDEVELSGSNVMQVLYLANKYVVPSLATKCTEFLESNLGPENVFDVLPSAVKLGDESLVSKCWEIIDKEGSQAVKSEPFKCIDKTLLVSVLERSTINCPEVDLFKAMMEWASNECKRRGRADSGEEKRNVLGEELLYLCRFPLMSQAEFVDTVLEADVLNKNEIAQMFTYFVKFSDEKLCFSTDLRTERPEAEVLNMSRFKRYEQPNQIKDQWRYTDGKKDCLTFSVDQPIRIHGVTLFGSIGSSYTVEFWLKRNQHSTDYLFHKKNSHISVWKEEGYHGYDVMFDKPILLSPKQEYTIETLIQGPRSFYGAKGKCSRQFNGITFTFRDNRSPNCTTVTSGQFSRIIFTKLAC